MYRLYGNQWIALSTALMTALMLVWGDYIPKVLGTLYWKKLADFTAYLLMSTDLADISDRRRAGGGFPSGCAGAILRK